MYAPAGDDSSDDDSDASSPTGLPVAGASSPFAAIFTPQLAAAVAAAGKQGVIHFFLLGMLIPCAKQQASDRWEEKRKGKRLFCLSS